MQNPISAVFRRGAMIVAVALAATTMGVSPATAASSATSVGAFTYEVDAGPRTATLTGWSGARQTTITIPATISVSGTTYRVTTIGYGAFAGPVTYVLPDQSPKPATSATIPEGVTTIEDFAFYGNRLSNVTIPSTVDWIGRSAFDQDYFVYPGGQKNPLRSVTFTGPAPDLSELGSYICSPGGCDYNGRAPFGTGNNLILYYPSGAAGFTTPVWGGYLAAPSGTRPIPTGYGTHVGDMLVTTDAPAIAGATLTARLQAWAVGGKFSPTPTTIDYLWQVQEDGGAWTTLGTGKTMTLPANGTGKALRITVVANGPGSRTAVLQLGGVTVIKSRFTAKPTPTITLPGGVTQATKGTVLTASTVTGSQFTPAADSVEYQWYRNGKIQWGKTAQTYTVGSADYGTKITVRVTGERWGYVPATASSASVAVPRHFAKTRTLSVTGSYTVGTTVAAQWSGGWSPTPTLAYSWKLDGTVVSTTSKYTIQAADQGKSLTLQVTATKSGYLTVVKTVAAKPVVREFTAAPTPALTLEAPTTLRATPGTWAPTATLSYQWYRGSSSIKNATSETYTPVKGDRGAKIRVRITATLEGYRTTKVYSAWASVSKSGVVTPPVAPAP